MAKKKPHQPKLIQNRRARYDYELGDSFVVGLVLTGRETKSLRMGHGHLRGAYVTARGEELWLINATIAGTANIPITEEEQSRARKLLAKRREIDALLASKRDGRTIIPLEILTRGRFIKLRIALGKGKHKFDKRQVLKKRDAARDVSRALKSR